MHSLRNFNFFFIKTKRLKGKKLLTDQHYCIYLGNYYSNPINLAQIGAIDSQKIIPDTDYFETNTHGKLFTDKEENCQLAHSFEIGDI